MSIKILINYNEYIDINLTIKKNEFVLLTGESGSGKTTLLRILAGLEETNGEIEVFNKRYLDKNYSLPPQKREVALVFQDYALFENMSVEQNLLYVQNDKILANRLLRLTQLTELKNCYPNTLSGGQKQRVALARTLMKCPKLLLLDEPLSALNWQIRKASQIEIAKIHKEFDLTTIMVSHDRAEVLKLADRVVELKNGKVILNTKIDSNYKAVKELVIKAEVVKIFKEKAFVVANNELVEVANKGLKLGDIVELKLQ